MRVRHFKGKEYEILAEATHSETGEEMIIYKALYDDQKVWARPKHMFWETIERDGKKIQRFTKI